MVHTRSGWTSDDTEGDLEAPSAATSNFEQRHEGKPIKTMIGVVLLIVLALVLSRMHPAPHEISDPSATTGQVAPVR
jgi:hypothetical protein